MRRAFTYQSIMAVATVMAFAFTQPAHGRQQATRVYEGAWFSVRYPADFTAQPSQKSRTAAGHDSAFFVSPDRRVKFYVFSPQWGGQPDAMTLNSRREVILSQRVQEKAGEQVRWFTARARDGSYLRSWVDSETSNTRLVFGIQYSDQAALAHYRPQYLAFKRSLHQYGD